MADDDAGRRQVVALPRLDRTEFDYYLGWAHRLGMIDHWPVFECELHAAITVAFGLHEIPTDLDDTQATWIGDVHRRLSLLLLETKTARDPATRWDDFLERLWSDCQTSAFDPTVRGGRIVVHVEHDPPILDDHQEPGIPLRLLPWLDRMEFQRSITDTYRQQRPDHWPPFRAALCHTLSAAFGLNGTRADHDPSFEATRIDSQHRQLTQRLDQARERFDPAVQWEEFRETIWAGREAGTETR